MINLRTLLSTFDEKGTLLKWLKKVEWALNNATLESVQVVVIDDLHIKLKFVFADGTSIESPSIVLPQGPQGVQGIQGPQGVQGIQGPQGPQGESMLVYLYTPEWEGYTSELEERVMPEEFNRYPNEGEHAYVQYKNKTDGKVYMGTMKVLESRQDYTLLQGDLNFVEVTGPQGPAGGVATVQDLLNLLEGSAYISVDWNEGQTKAVVALDMTNVEDTPTQGSKKLLTSGGAFEALAGKLDSNKSSVAAVGGLVKPTATPTSTELVGISPSMEQERVKLGNGLTYDANTNTLSASNGGATGIDIGGGYNLTYYNSYAGSYGTGFYVLCGKVSYYNIDTSAPVAVENYFGWHLLKTRVTAQELAAINTICENAIAISGLFGNNFTKNSGTIKQYDGTNVPSGVISNLDYKLLLLYSDVKITYTD